MSAHKVYDDADRKMAIRLYKKGWGCLRISQIVGCYPSTIKGWVEKAIAAGADIEKHPKPNYPEKLKRKAIADYQKRKDLSLDKVAELHEVSSHTLRRWLEADGVLTRSTRPPMYDAAAILVDLKAGMKKKDIAAKHGCSESWVYRVQSGR